MVWGPCRKGTGLRTARKLPGGYVPKGSYGPYLRTLALTYETQPEGTWTTPPTWKTSAGFPITISSISSFAKMHFLATFLRWSLVWGRCRKGTGIRTARKLPGGYVPKDEVALIVIPLPPQMKLNQRVRFRVVGRGAVNRGPLREPAAPPGTTNICWP